MVDINQVRDLSDRDFGVPTPLKEDIEYEPVLVYSSPQPMTDAIDTRTDLILSANSNSRVVVTG